MLRCLRSQSGGIITVSGIKSQCLLLPLDCSSHVGHVSADECPSRRRIRSQLSAGKQASESPLVDASARLILSRSASPHFGRRPVCSNTKLFRLLPHGGSMLLYSGPVVVRLPGDTSAWLFTNVPRYAFFAEQLLRMQPIGAWCVVGDVVVFCSSRFVFILFVLWWSINTADEIRDDLHLIVLQLVDCSCHRHRPGVNCVIVDIGLAISSLLCT